MCWLPAVHRCQLVWLVLVRCVKALQTVFLKSQFEFSRGNCEKSLRMLSSAASHILNPASSVVVHGPLRNAAAMYFNNLGVAHFHLHKHNLGAFYLRRAAEENLRTLHEVHRQDGNFDTAVTPEYYQSVTITKLQTHRNIPIQGEKFDSVRLKEHLSFLDTNMLSMFSHAEQKNGEHVECVKKRNMSSLGDVVLLKSTVLCTCLLT